MEIVKKLSTKEYKLLGTCAYTWLGEFEELVMKEAEVNGRIDENTFQDFQDRIRATRWAISHVMQLLSSNGLIEPEFEFTFTDDEKAILSSLPERYNWISRSSSGGLRLHHMYPQKHHYIYREDFVWDDDTVDTGSFYSFNHIFKSVTSETPIEFRKYL